MRDDPNLFCIASIMDFSRLSPGPARSLREAIGSRHNNFNAVRLALSLMVVMYHAYVLGGGSDPLSRLMAPYMNTGRLAVGVFFILSGLFVTQSLLRDARIWAFAVKRVCRILPGLFVCVALTTLIAVACFSEQGAAGLYARPTWDYILGNSFLHYLKPDIPANEMAIGGVFASQSPPVINGSLWSLYWEAKFYILLAIMGAMAVTPIRYWLAGVSSLLLLLALTLPGAVQGYFWELQLLSLFLCGVLLKTISGFVVINARHVAAVCAFFYLTGWGAPAFNLFLLAGTIALWLGTVPVQFSTYLETHDYSFSLFIYHWPVMQMLRIIFPELNPIALFASCCVISLPIVALSWVYVEKPAIRWGHSLCKRLGKSANATV